MPGTPGWSLAIAIAAFLFSIISLVVTVQNSKRRATDRERFEQESEQRRVARESYTRAQALLLYLAVEFNPHVPGARASYRKALNKLEVEINNPYGCAAIKGVRELAYDVLGRIDVSLGCDLKREYDDMTETLTLIEYLRQVIEPGIAVPDQPAPSPFGHE